MTTPELSNTKDINNVNNVNKWDYEQLLLFLKEVEPNFRGLLMEQYVRCDNKLDVRNKNNAELGSLSSQE
jgi:hypothetical protein